MIDIPTSPQVVTAHTRRSDHKFSHRKHSIRQRALSGVDFEGTLASDEPINAVNPDGARALVSNGATTIQVVTSAWPGTADALMDQYDNVRERSDEADDRLFAVTGERTSATTSSGVTGVQESYASATGEGRAFAFVIDTDEDRSIGVVITASAAEGTLSQDESQVDDFVASLTSPGATS